MGNFFKILLDNRNQDLWDELNGRYTIKVVKRKEPGYFTVFNSGEIKIEVDIENLNPASFTHELLHIYLKYREVCIAADLERTVENHEDLNKLFSESLINHLGNCLEHSKMLPLYLARGFDNSDFVRDFDIKIMEEEELQRLEATYIQSGSYSRDGFDKYLGKFFSMKSSNNSSFNYDRFYLGLQKIDPELFEVADLFWNDWQKFEIGNPKQHYQKMLQEFGRGLLKWQEDKLIV